MEANMAKTGNNANKDKEDAEEIRKLDFYLSQCYLFSLHRN